MQRKPTVTNARRAYADRLGVSGRTIYRDIGDLSAGWGAGVCECRKIGGIGREVRALTPEKRSRSRSNRPD
jgi:predicted DNA-binding transcriptional regulator YafY